MVRILEHGIAYRDSRFHAAFPSIVRFADDTLLLAFRRARNGLWLVPVEQRAAIGPVDRMDHIDSRSHIALMELDAAGSVVAAPLDMLPADPEAADQDPSLLVLPGDRLFLASFSWYPLPSDVDGLVRGRVPPDGDAPGCRYLFWGSHSALRGHAAGDWLAHHRYLDPPAGCGGVVGALGERRYAGPLRGQPLYRDGEILLAVYGGEMRGCVLFASADEGLEWQQRGVIARNVPGGIAYQEPALCRDPQGGLVCFMRTDGADGRLATTRSADGVRWEEPRLHALVGHPFHPLPLDDGRVLLSYGYRQPPYGVRARLLDDASTDPDSVPEIVVRADGRGRDLGYPWAVQLRDGRVLLTYYWTGADGVRQIAFSWLEHDA